MKSIIAPILFAISTQFVFAGAITTVPWNGYKGAASFTFDDGLQNQIDNVIPALASRNIHASFFVVGSSLSNDWITAAKDGNEIGNHTQTHTNLPGLDTTTVHSEIVEEAIYLRSLDPSIEAVTLAYPYCTTNTLVDSITNSENIIARTCGGNARFSWSSKPANWMRLTSYIISDSTSIANLPGEVDYAALHKTWFVTLVHGVGAETGNTPTQVVLDMFDRAISDSLWIGTYQQVAAYWRASFTMDTVKATTNATGWHLSWISPHTRMPKNVHLRIKLDSTTFGKTIYLYQNGQLIQPQSDGTYIIEFMNLQLDVSTTPSTSIQHKSQKMPAGLYHYRLENLAGQTIREGQMDVPNGVTSNAVVISEDKQPLIMHLLGIKQ